MNRARSHRWPALLAILGMLLVALALPARAPLALASNTPAPTSVTIAGSQPDQDALDTILYCHHLQHSPDITFL